MSVSTRLLLWPEGAPFAAGQGAEDIPAMTVCLPKHTNGTAVVVCPGGGYGMRAEDHEGRQIAEWLNARGVAAFITHYRVAPYHHPVPLLDAQRALRTVRAGAVGWGVDPARIGIWGFSAGGHLASTAATHFDAGAPTAADPIDRAGCRPDFAILSYPVISMLPPYTHEGSRDNLLGDQQTPALFEALSNERQVTAETPPTFLFHTDNDPVVPAENSALFYLALRRAGVPAEMHIFADGPHGVGLAQHDPTLSPWSQLLETWLRGRGLLAGR